MEGEESKMRQNREFQTKTGSLQPSDWQCGGLQRRLDITMNVLRPSVRLLLAFFVEDLDLIICLEDVHNTIEKLLDLLPQPSHSEILNSMAEGILRFSSSVDIDFESVDLYIHSRKLTLSELQTKPENVVLSLDSAFYILQWIYYDECIVEQDPTISWNIMKNEISDTLFDLEFLGNLSWMVWKQIRHFNSDQHILPALLALLICSYFAPLVGSKQQVTPEFSSNFKIGITLVMETLQSHVRQLYDTYHGSHRLQVRNDMDITSFRIIDQKVLNFFDCLINKLRKQDISSGDQMESAVEELAFLKSNFLDVIQVYSLEDFAVKEMDSLCLSTIALIIETTFQTYFSFRYSAHHIDFYSDLPHLMEAVDSLKLQASNSFSGCKIFTLPSSLPSSGSTNRKESMSCLIKNLEKLVDYKAAPIFLLKPQIETFYQVMEPLKNFLSANIANHCMENSQVEVFMAQIKVLANQSNFIIGLFFSREGPLWYHKLGLFVVSYEVKMIFKKIKPVLEKLEASYIKAQSSPSLAIVGKAMNSIDRIAHVKLVGVLDAVDEIMEKLTRGPTYLKIISIVGMPGLGKTTVANYVYDDPSINLHFHVRAWFSVSQVYKKVVLLGDILSQVSGKTSSSIEELNGDDLVEALYRNLKGRRYLIVLDDIWDIKVWRDLQGIFPNDHNGSRILFTTRHRDVARKANSQLYNLRLLSTEESCKLLFLKVFGSEACPPNLSIVSRRIANNCKGLPLSVILVAGTLIRTKRSKESWQQVAGIVISLKDEGCWDIMPVINILELSYKQLPPSLKPCFLYFSVFPEDSSISVSKLIQLWISEGFVQEENLDHESIEEEAKSYLTELIDKSLVMVTKRSSRGGVKACHIHNVLRNFCYLKSQQENLIAQESMFGGIIRRHHCSFMYYNIPNQEDNSDVEWGEQHSEKPVHDLLSERPVFNNKLHPHMVVFSEKATLPLGQLRWSGLDHNFVTERKSLRVLDLGNVRIGSSAETADIIMIATLVHLRFLGIRPRSGEIPAEVGNLLKLETLILTGAIGIIKLPESLWKLSRLRNVLMDHGYFSFQYCSRDIIDTFHQLYDLRAVSTLSIQYGDCVEAHFLRRLPYIQKLECRFVYSWDNTTGRCVFPVLDYLNQLESLKVFFGGVARYPCTLSFPSRLKKLSLSNSRLPWDAISVIMMELPNLEVLKLLKKAFEGPHWNTEDCIFPKLKFLKLECLDIQIWNANDEPFPRLEQLVVVGCSQLEEIPSSFGDISTLQLLEMKWCSSSAMDSVNQILQVQRDFNNYQLKVTLIGSG